MTSKTTIYFHHNSKFIIKEVLKGYLSSCFGPQMPSKCVVIGYCSYFIYDISSALFGPKIAMKVNLDPNMCEI